MPENMFPKIGEVVEGEEVMPTAMESLCMACYKNGTTRMLLTEIPFFRQVILMSFRCPHCGFSNNEIQPGSAVQETGGTYTLRMTSVEDLQRQVVKSETAVVRVEDLDFEIPAGRGVLTTLEGLLSSALEQLRETQEERRRVDPAVATQVDDFVAKLAMLLSGVSMPMRLTMDDPSGNSFLENPCAPRADPNLEYKTYVRTREQQAALGLQAESYELSEEEAAARCKEAERAETAKLFPVKEGATIGRDKNEDSTMMEKEVYQIPSNCPNCNTPGTTKTCLTDIPFFRELIIMAFDCLNDDCGYRTSEIKGGGAIPALGQRVSLRVEPKDAADPHTWVQDMKRDVVKSNSAGVMIPELEVEVTQGSLGGMYTTVEGLLDLIKESLFGGTASDFARGDSASAETRGRFEALEARFQAIIDGESGFTLELVDPLASSFIYSPTAPEPEPRLTIVEYERSHEENEELGLNDMCVEGYDEVVSEPKPEQQDVGEFQPSATFQGARPGFYFGLGTRGLGYYEDAAQHTSVAREEAHSRMQALQKDGKEAHPNPSAVQD